MNTYICIRDTLDVLVVKVRILKRVYLSAIRSRYNNAERRSDAIGNVDQWSLMIRVEYPTKNVLHNIFITNRISL